MRGVCMTTPARCSDEKMRHVCCRERLVVFFARVDVFFVCLFPTCENRITPIFHSAPAGCSQFSLFLLVTRIGIKTPRLSSSGGIFRSLSNTFSTLVFFCLFGWTWRRRHRTPKLFQGTTGASGTWCGRPFARRRLPQPSSRRS